jgi:hypothetical protein
MKGPSDHHLPSPLDANKALELMYEAGIFHYTLPTTPRYLQLVKMDYIAPLTAVAVGVRLRYRAPRRNTVV